MPFGRSFTIDEATNRIDNEGYAYDNAGNMTDDTSHEYAYDAENRLVTVDGGTTATYSYDGDGQRVQKLALSGAEGSSGTLYWYGPGGEVLQETDGAGTLLRDFIYFNGQRVARREANNTVYFFFSDHLGSARVVTDASGGVVEESDFYPYGREIVITDLLQGSQDNPYKFTGQERDPETSLDYFGARYYSYTLGRFVQTDPLGGHQEDPQTLNRYVYARNNPLRFTDPTGLDFYLQCTETKDNKETCQFGVVGTTDDKGNFTATVVTSASLQDPNSGNTATVNENGVLITTNGQTYQGEFISNTPAADIQGSGALQDFSFHINGNCNGTCMSSGTWTYNGRGDSLNAVRALLGQRGAFTIPFEDIFAGFGVGAHPFSTQHRFGSANCSVISCPNSPHLSVQYDPGTSNYVDVTFVSMRPRANVPASGEFHVDAHADYLGHFVDVISK